MKKISVLIPTYNRPTGLAVTFTSLCMQIEQNFDIIISDQTKNTMVINDPSIKAVIRVLDTHHHRVTIYKHLPRRGMAEQRQFLLEQATTLYILFLDDDLILEPFVIRNLYKTIAHEQCGFVGAAVIGLSYLNHIRKNELSIELWNGKVQPEYITPHDPKWQRYLLHNAANIYHMEKFLQVTPQEPKKYKVAWLGGCVLYDREKLNMCGGFSFWKELPKFHCGEDVLAQLRVMDKYGGCGIIPSGVYHQELPTTVLDRNVNAPEILHNTSHIYH